LYSLIDLEFYIGYTENYQRKMQEHEQGRSKNTACRRPFVPLLCKYYFSKKDAMRREEYYKTTAGKRKLRFMLFSSLREQNYPPLME